MFSSFPPHPGTVTFIGEDGIARTEAAEQLPGWLKFATAADGSLVPVVRIVRVVSDRGIGLRSYGPNGRLIAVTLPVPVAPPELAEVAERPNFRRTEPTHELSGWF